MQLSELEPRVTNKSQLSAVNGRRFLLNAFAAAFHKSELRKPGSSSRRAWSRQVEAIKSRFPAPA